ncbi:MAG TPA: DUF4369 domain-containing protein, partial [Flavisolibacter sp.]|nr:DUF4369 domain-containing protein [Flavisolibacter sp.]
MKRFLFAFASLLMLITETNAQTNAANRLSIKGFMPAWNNANVQLLVNGNFVYSGTVSKDLFSYTGKVDETNEGLLKITRNRQTVYLPLFIEPGTIKIRDEGKKLVAFGTPTNDTYIELMHQFDSLALLQKQLRFDEVKHFKRQLATAYIQQHSNSPISLKLLADYFYLDVSANDVLYYQLYNSLDTALRKSYTGKKMEPEVNLRY